MKKRLVDDDLYLIELIQNIWRNKIKVVSIILIFIIFSLIYYHYIQKPIYVGSTEIRPISKNEEYKYGTYNLYLSQLTGTQPNIIKKNENELIIDKNNDRPEYSEYNDFQKIDKQFLFTFFLDRLIEGKEIEEAIKKIKLIDQKDYNNIQAYEDDVKKISSSIKIVSTNNSIQNNPRLEFTTDDKDKEKWTKILILINKSLNQNIRSDLNNVINNSFKNNQKLTQYKIEDIDIEIKNSIENYENEITDRLVFLNEQSAIARKLNITKNNTLEVLTISDKILTTTVNTEMPYYLRGYEMIDKEIDLIKDRDDDNNKAFVKNLRKLQRMKKELISNKYSKRLESLFNETPIAKGDNFYAGNLSYLSTKYTNENAALNLKILLTLSILLGFIFAIFYILLEKTIKLKN